MEKAIKEIEELFGTKAKNGVIYYNDITYTPIPKAVVDAVKAIMEEYPELGYKIGLYSVKIYEQNVNPIIQSSRNIMSSKLGKIHDDFVTGEITKAELRKKLEEQGADADTLIEKWSKEVIKSALTYDIYKDGKFIDTTNDFFEAANYETLGYEVRRIECSANKKKVLIKNSKSASECFGVSESDGEEIEELARTFTNKSELRSVLADYFHIYDDLAEMSEDDFNASFEEYFNDSSITSALISELKRLNPITSGYSMVGLKAIKDSDLKDDTKKKLADAYQNQKGDAMAFHDTFVNLTYPELGKQGCIALWKKLFTS